MRSLKICPIVMLLILLIVPTAFGDLLTEEEIDSMIELDRLYPGSAVREFAKTLIRAAHEEIRKTGEEAAAEVARSLVPEITALEIIVKGQRREMILGRLKWGVGGTIGGFFLGFVTGQFIRIPIH